MSDNTITLLPGQKINEAGLIENADGTIPGSVIKVWKPEWNSWHFAIVADGQGCIRYLQDNPKCFVEMCINDDGEWDKCPIEDYRFIKETLGDSAIVRMRQC